MKRFDTIMRIAATLSLAAGATLLNGCIPLVIGGAVVTAQVATDRRTTGAQLDDEFIEDKAIAQISDRLKSDIHVNVTSYNGIALLTGEAPTEASKNEVAQVVRSMPKVRIVQNELVVVAHQLVFGPHQRHGDHVEGQVTISSRHTTSSRSITSRSSPSATSSI
jgi:osmotically-inducible protein OsmY